MANASEEVHSRIGGLAMHSGTTSLLGTKVQKKEVDTMDGKKQEFVDELFEYLKEQGVNPRKQVKCGERIADIVTDDTVYEVVANVDAEVIRSEIPHVLACRNELDPRLMAV